MSVVSDWLYLHVVEGSAALKHADQPTDAYVGTSRFAVFTT